MVSKSMHAATVIILGFLCLALNHTFYQSTKIGAPRTELRFSQIPSATPSANVTSPNTINQANVILIQNQVNTVSLTVLSQAAVQQSAANIPNVSVASRNAIYSVLDVKHNYLYGIQQDTGNIIQIDVDHNTNKIVCTRSGAYQLLLSPDNLHLLIISQDSARSPGAVSAIFDLRKSICIPIQSPMGFRRTPEWIDNTFFVVGGGNSFTIVDVNTQQRTLVDFYRYSSLDFEGVVPIPNTSNVLFPHRVGGDIVRVGIYNFTDNTVEDLPNITYLGEPSMMNVSPDGKYITYCGGYECDIIDRTAAKIINHQSDIRQAIWTSDSLSLVMVVGTEQAIIRLDVPTFQKQTLGHMAQDSYLSVN